MKKILLFPVRNEEWILEQTLCAASLWADHIIVADHNSSDATPEILCRFPKISIIQNTNEFHTSTIRRELLAEARKIDGPKVIFSFDADEVPTADILDQDFWEKIERLAPGTAIELLWVNLWRSTGDYRVDAGPQEPTWKAFGFVDDGKAEYTSLGVINDHTSRLPSGLRSTVRFRGPRVLHFQFVDWNRMLAKQAHYRMTEWLQKRRSWGTALKINLKYFPTKDERGARFEPVPEQWLSGYMQRGVQINVALSDGRTWHHDAVSKLFGIHGLRFFAPLDIWDVPWGVVSSNERLPFRVRMSSFMQRTVVRVLAYRNWAARLWTAVHSRRGHA